MKRLLISIIAISALLIPATALAQFTTVQGGTGTTSPSGILYGDGTLHLKTVNIGSNLTFSGGTLSATGGSGGSGNIATSSAETANYIPWWTSTNGTPATLSGGSSVFQWLNPGLLVIASTTIGNGTQTGGVTVNGGATTTLNAYFAGNVGIRNITPTVPLVVGTNTYTSGASPHDSFSVFGSNYGYFSLNAAAAGNVGFALNQGSGNGGSGNTFSVIGIEGTSTDPNYGLDGTAGNIIWNTYYGGAFKPIITVPVGTSNSIFGGNVGIGTTTPGSLLSLNNIANFTTATSTFYGNGLNLEAGCYAVNGTCTLSSDPNWLETAGYLTPTSTAGAILTASSTVLGNFTATGFINVGANGAGYQQAGNTVLYASTTNISLAVGASAAAAWMSASSTAWDDIAIGTSALGTTPTSGAAQFNTAIGISALFPDTTGARNTATGYHSMASNTTGSFNVSYGFNASAANMTGQSNVAIGYLTIENATSSSDNTVIGFQAGLDISGATGLVGNNNTLFGAASGQGITTGGRNVFFGPSTIAASENQVTTGSNNISIGNDVAIASSTLSNQLDIGNEIYGTGLSGTGSTLSTGNIGIGTTTPWGKLSITGNDTLSTTQAFVIADSNNNPLFNVNDAGSIGIGTTTPFAKLSIAGTSGGTTPLFAISSSTSAFATTTTFLIDSNGNTTIGNNGSVLTVNGATSTHANGINLTTGCFAIAGTCIGGSSGSVTGVTATWPVLSSGGTAPVISWGGIATSSNISAPQVLYATGANSFAGVSTTSLGVTGPITFSGTLGAQIGGAGGSFGCATCNTSNATVSSVGLSSTNSTLIIGSTPVTTSGTITADLNLTHSNWWTATQNFTNASTSEFTATSTAWFLGNTFFGSTQQTEISSTGVLTLGTPLTIAQGGTGQNTQQAALNALMPATPNAGEVAYYNGSNWVGLAGNSSGTNWLQETSSGVPSWTTPAGTVTSVSGTANQVTVSPTTGAAVVSLPNLVLFPLDASTTEASVFNELFVGQTATTTIFGNGATSTFQGTLVVASTSPNAFAVQDQYGTQDLLMSTASSTNNQPQFQIQATSTSNIIFQVDQYGHIMASSTRATPGISSCGTGSPAMGVNANDDVGSFTTGTSASACTITFASAYSQTPVVVVSDSNTTAVIDISSISTTAFTISLASALSADTVYYMVEMP